MNNDIPTEIPTTIDLKDIVTVKELIEICASRGIIHPKSFPTLGALWNKFDTIISKMNITSK